MSRHEGSLATRILEHMKEHPQAWRAAPLAEALKCDTNAASTVLSQIYAEGKGPLTRCQVTLHGSARPFFEYRIAEGASGANEVNRPTDFKISAPKRPPRRDELEAPTPPAVEKPAKKARKVKKAAAPKKTRKPAKTKKARAPYGSRKKTKKTKKAKVAKRPFKRLLKTIRKPKPEAVSTPQFAYRSEGSLAIVVKGGAIVLRADEAAALRAFQEAMA